MRHKCFISYHHSDQKYVDEFVRKFSSERRVFIARALGTGFATDIIDSRDTDYVMRRIRELYLRDSTVTIVMLGRCTGARRYVDWEIQSSLRRGQTVTPNGLLGVRLPSLRQSDAYPKRLNMNLSANGEDCYARVIDYPRTATTLAKRIDDAFGARSQSPELIRNPRKRFQRNRKCTR